MIIEYGFFLVLLYKYHKTICHQLFIEFVAYM